MYLKKNVNSNRLAGSLYCLILINQINPSNKLSPFDQINQPTNWPTCLFVQTNHSSNQSDQSTMSYDRMSLAEFIQNLFAKKQKKRATCRINHFVSPNILSLSIRLAQSIPVVGQSTRQTAIRSINSSKYMDIGSCPSCRHVC